MSSFPKLLRENAVRWTGEFLVIVVGILAALAVDGWVQDRQDREMEVAYLERLIDDLEWDLRELDNTVRTYRRNNRAITSILTLIGDPYPGPLPAFDFMEVEPLDQPLLPADSVALALNWAVAGTREFDHRRSTYDELLATGTLRVIRNKELRTQVVDYYALVQTVLAQHLEILRGSSRRLSEYLISEGYAVQDIIEFVEEPLPILRRMERLGPALRARRQSVLYANGLSINAEPWAEDLKAALVAELDELR